MKGAPQLPTALVALAALLDSRTKQYQDLAGVDTFAEYALATPYREDEEMLTEPVLTQIMERVLGFPPDAYYPQYGRSGLKPDLTPMDPIAHRFVLDAKSSLQDLDKHEDQIRKYVDQRQLDAGVLFNLAEIRTYRAGKSGYDPQLSFALTPLWSYARGESMEPPELAKFTEFVTQFGYRELSFDDRVKRVASELPWDQRDPKQQVEIDVDFLVERLRALSKLLAGDAEKREGDLLGRVELNPGLETRLLRELEVLALDLAPGTSPETLPDSISGYASADGLASRTWKQYLLRVSQLALARILLYRSWEDAGFVASYLYDGGFKLFYERLDESVRDVLNQAFLQGIDAYRWLYGADSNYDWYRPSDEPLIEVLYSLTPFPLGRLDADVLGGLYESYVDEIDRDRLGQFYTPRSVVRFMLGRAGMEGEEGVFRIAGDERHPLRVLDFATGSGGFLVEAARRIIDEASILEKGDVKGLREALRAIVRGLHGSEISPFPYYLTEINLLLQVSRLLGALRLAGEETPPFALSVVHVDTLTARGTSSSSIEGLAPSLKADHAELVGDEAYGLVPLDADKREAFTSMRKDGTFDLVVGNPPYVFESNNRILFERLRAITAWQGDYSGKSDLLYYFLALASEKVREGGRMCVITPAGWMNAGNADWLREKLAGTLRLDELFLFGSYRLFAPEREVRGRRYPAPTPTVESSILIATKGSAPAAHKLRIVALEDERAAAETLARREDDVTPDREKLLDEMARRFAGRQGRKGGIHVHDIRQRSLDHQVPWPIKHAPKDVAARVVRRLDGGLKEGRLEPLSERWWLSRGIETGADAFSPGIQRRLENEYPDAKAELDAHGSEIGAPIMELPAGAEAVAPWSDNPELLARSIEPTAILYGAMDEAESTSLVWIDRDEEVVEAVRDALLPWRPVLASRAEFRRNAKRRWFETAWSRDKDQLRRPKVIALYRTDRGRFALDETGDWQPSNKATLAIAKHDDLSVAYLCGLLNSELLDLWYGVRGKTPRDVWRNYEPKPMARIPYRHVAAAADEPAVEELRLALDGGSADDAFAAAMKIGEAPVDDAAAAGAIEVLVRAIAANRRDLLPLRSFDAGLTRVIKNPWRVGPVDVGAAAVLKDVPAGDRVSVRLDPGLSASFETDGTLGKHLVEDGKLVFSQGKKRTAELSGSVGRLALVDLLIGNERKLLPDDLNALTLPKDLADFAATIAEREAQISELLKRGRVLAEAVERLTCRLYGVPRELEDAVVASAVARATDPGEAEPEA